MCMYHCNLFNVFSINSSGMGSPIADALHSNSTLSLLMIYSPPSNLPSPSRLPLKPSLQARYELTQLTGFINSPSPIHLSSGPKNPLESSRKISAWRYSLISLQPFSSCTTPYSLIPFLPIRGERVAILSASALHRNHPGLLIARITTGLSFQSSDAEKSLSALSRFFREMLLKYCARFLVFCNW